jgi:cytochrome c oxidase accessory protein FixG
MTTTDPARLNEPVLSTLNQDGSRRWLRPKPSKGRFLTRRRVVAYVLILIFTALPWIPINGKPAMLLDLAKREFTFFGKTFLPTDTLLLALLILSVFVSIFLMTALFGRVWCGWGCPQTVYMEFVYRPIERLFDGRSYRDGGRTVVHPVRRAGKYLAFLFISLFLSHTFLAYFVGVESLFEWMTQSPFEHPKAFLIVMFVTGLMMLDFCVLREQVCTLMCPYGRMQSVLLDRESMIVTYDPQRGEPRGKAKRRPKSAPQHELITGTTDRGDCIDCHLCVVTCPTGIDIRDGLQMECIACTQCIDACDTVMDRIGKPRGLIRFSSQDAIEGKPRKLLRPRVVLYPLVLVVLLTLFGVTLASKNAVDVVFLRNRATPYSVLENGAVSNQVSMKLTNRSGETREYEIAVLGEVEVVSKDLNLTIEANDTRSATLRVIVPRDQFERGRADVTIRVTDDTGYSRDFNRHLLGPLFGAPVSSPPPPPPPEIGASESVGDDIEEAAS